MSDTQYVNSILDALNQMRNYGLQVDKLEATGKITRVKTDADKGKSKSGWYSVQEHFIGGKSVYSGVYGDWRGGYSVFFRTGEDTQEIRQHLRQAAEALKAEKLKLALAAKAEAARIWATKTKVLSMHQAGQHPYMVRKQLVAPCELHGLYRSLCLPITRYDANGNSVVVSLQTIGADGSKFFSPKHAPVEGGSFIIPGIEFPDTSLIVEGFATGVSCWMATGCEIIVTFNAVNLLPACEHLLSMGKLKPNRIICADDDELTYRNFVKRNHPRPINPGLSVAREAAAHIRAKMSWPRFVDRESCIELSDFNDLHCREGLAVVRDQLSSLLR